MRFYRVHCGNSLRLVALRARMCKMRAHRGTCQSASIVFQLHAVKCNVSINLAKNSSDECDDAGGNTTSARKAPVKFSTFLTFSSSSCNTIIAGNVETILAMHTINTIEFYDVKRRCRKAEQRERDELKCKQMKKYPRLNTSNTIQSQHNLVLLPSVVPSLRQSGAFGVQFTCKHCGWV